MIRKLPVIVEVYHHVRKRKSPNFLSRLNSVHITSNCISKIVFFYSPQYSFRWKKITYALSQLFLVCSDMVLSLDNKIYTKVFLRNLCSDTDDRLSWRDGLSLCREAAHYLAQVSTDSLIINVLTSNLNAERFTLWLELRFDPVSALTVTYFSVLTEQRYR
jgi:hypothetical protein